MSTLGGMLTDLVALGPERPALTCDDVTLSFGELDARANRVAHALRRHGLVPGDRVGVLSRNRPEYVELLFGAARAGVVLVGLNWRLAPPEIAAVLDNAGPRLVLAGTAEQALVPDGVEVVDLDAGYE
ncbi:MAG: AMP-binding protein [Pseudonocardia sediminis]